MDNNQAFFAPCPRGLEAVLAAELEQLGAQAVATTQGGVGFSTGTKRISTRRPITLPGRSGFPPGTRSRSRSALNTVH